MIRAAKVGVVALAVLPLQLWLLFCVLRGELGQRQWWGLAAATAAQAEAAMRSVVLAEHSVSLQAEIDNATALLEAAGIEARVDVRMTDLSPCLRQVLAWSVREGVTNVLRHSAATECTITAIRRDATVILTIANDGSGPAGEGGSGIAGLTARAQALSGKVTAGDSGGGWFRLVITLPETEEAL